MRLPICIPPLVFARVIGLVLLLSGGARAFGETLSFEKDIRPILKAQCFHCHGEEGEKRGQLDVRLRRFLVQGGKSGPAIVPGDPAGSHLLEMIESGEMPKEKPRLPEREIETIRRWIAAGAPTARPEPEKIGSEASFTEEERKWWSLQPIVRRDPPATSGEPHPIDAFLGARLREMNLSFAESATPEVLIRRVTFDLTGLPPSPEEIAAYTAAHAKDPTIAWNSLLDRLLASPAYGETWARHWLDVAGYADSDGFTEADTERPHAHRYRDYVIQALNEDKPFDVFIREQLAGDEIAAMERLHPDSPGAGRERYATLLAATGFLRMGPDGTATKNDVGTRNACISATVKIVGTALYGLTIGCAECHDHRYDPITQADYYRLRAVFEPGFDPSAWRVPNARLVSLQTTAAKAESAKIETEARKLDEARTVKQNEFIAEVLGKELEKRPAEIRATLRTAFETPAAKRTAAQTALLKAHPTIEKLSGGSLYLYDTTYRTKHADTLKKMADEAAAVRARKPREDFVHAFTEVARDPGAMPVTKVFHRGDPESPKEAVRPGDLSVLASFRVTGIPEDDPALSSSGRRLALARALTDGSHPLLARVLVNRVWMHHFGKGIVTSPGDFGRLGAAPSHPELLDWLAARFVDQGWSLKDLHRLILTSKAWRQSSNGSDRAASVDPDNRWLSHQNVRRLGAETIRDSLLAVSGKLNRKMGGPPVPVMFTEEGQVVIGVDTTDTAGRQTGKFIPLNGEEFRRSVYIQVRRSRQLDMFATFDAPSMTEANCEVRPLTTVSPQSLLLMNHLEMREHARHFAERLRADAAADPEKCILAAWRLAYGRPPSPAESARAREFLVAQTAFYRSNPATLERVSGPQDKEPAPAETLGLTALCHAVMSANEFLYLD
ncbi:MAG: DUF1553 domain-containing protein [Verrucomicrobia bacterium]|nr:DUF1553 domain-containing protein [Verrucomicrobiota bacterium]